MGGSTWPVDASVVEVDIDDRQQAHLIAAADLSALLSATVAAQHQATTRRVCSTEVGLTFVETEEMAKLNIDHMGGSGPTDVLAFPIDGVGDVDVPDDQPLMLGDIVICPAVAADAPQPLADELALLVVHGALHLLGHDHAEPAEAAVMKALEVEMLDRFYQS